MTTIEGGALIVATEDEARAIEVLRFHGIVRLPDGTRDVTVPGGKFNLPDVNAAVGLSQLARLDAFNARRRELVARYFARFATEPACLLPHRGHAGDEAGHSWNMFAPLLPLDRLTLSRKAFRDELEARGIGTGVSYEAAHLATAYAPLGYRRGDLPNTERIADRDGHAAVVPDHDRGRRRSRVRDLRRGHRRAPPLTPMPLAPALSVVIPVYNEEAGLAALFARLYPALDALGIGYEVIFVNDGSRDRSAALLREQFQRRPDVTRVVAVQRQLRPAPGDHGRLRALPRRARRHARRRPAEPARGHRPAARGDGRGPRLRRPVRRTREDSCVAPLGLARDEPAARAHHAHQDDRPGLHAARLQRATSSPRSPRAARSAPSSRRSPTPSPRSPTEVEVGHEERAAGESKYSLYKLIRLNFDLVTGFSLVPLQLFSMFGMAVSAMALRHLRRRDRDPDRDGDRGSTGTRSPPSSGTATLAFFLIGMLLFGLGLLGEYVGRIYQQVRAPAALHRARGPRRDAGERPTPAASAPTEVGRP